MVHLETVYYGKEDGEMTATELYSDGSTRQVRIKNGITDYILTGSIIKKDVISEVDEHA